MQTIALTARQYGRPDILQLAPVDLPPLDSQAALIRVEAAGINPVDARRLTGELRIGTLPPVLRHRIRWHNRRARKRRRALESRRRYYTFRLQWSSLAA